MYAAPSVRPENMNFYFHLIKTHILKFSQLFKQINHWILGTSRNKLSIFFTFLQLCCADTTDVISIKSHFMIDFIACILHFFDMRQIWMGGFQIEILSIPIIEKKQTSEHTHKLKGKQYCSITIEAVWLHINLPRLK